MQRRKFIPLLIILTISLLLSLSAFAVNAAPAAAKLVGLNGGPCTYTTIADAIANARPDVVNTIFILPGAYNEQLENITEDIIFVPANVGCRTEFTGANSDTVVIDASNQTSDGTGGLAHVLGTGDPFRPDPTYVTFRHMTLRDGTASNGGVLAATTNGHITLEDVNVIGGSATNGGGIYVSSSSVTLTDDSEVTNNNATDGGGVYGYASTINLYDVSIGKSATTGNLATMNGGGVYVDRSTVNLTIQGFVRYNEAEQKHGGGIYAARSTVDISLSQVEHNEARERGGGIYLYDGSLTMNGGAVRHNRVLEVDSSGRGGGIAAWDDTQTNDATSVLLDLVLIDQNTAYKGGGLSVVNADVTIRNGTSIRNNGAGEDGGGISAVGGVVTVTDSAEIVHNSAVENGGGISARGGLLILQDNALVAENTSTGHGGGFYFVAANSFITSTVITGNVATQSGGGLYALSSELALSDSTISHNSTLAGSGGGAHLRRSKTTFDAVDVLHNVSATTGGGISYDDASVSSIFGDMSFRNGTMAFNQAAESGGGFHLSELFRTTVINNTIISNNESGDLGGGVHAFEAALELNNSQVVFNDAGTDGGGVALQRNRQFEMIGNVFKGNSADEDGGGISINCLTSGQTYLIADSLVEGNSAQNGGGIAVSNKNSFFSHIGCQVELRNLVIKENGTPFQDGLGGGLFVNNALVTMRAWPGSAETGGCDPTTLAYDHYCSELRDNTAAYGGGVYISDTSNFVGSSKKTEFLMESTAVLENSGMQEGSGVYLTSSGSNGTTPTLEVSATIAHSYFRDNNTSTVIINGALIDLSLYYNTLVDHAVSPLWIIDADSTLTMTGNVITGNAIGPYRGTGVELEESRNYMQAVAPGSLSLPSDISVPLGSPPLFTTDPVRGPHRLAFNSPFVNEGGWVIYAVDADLNARPAGSRLDVGAFEYGADPAVPTAVGIRLQGTGDGVQVWLLIAAVLLTGTTNYVWRRRM